MKIITMMINKIFSSVMNVNKCETLRSRKMLKVIKKYGITVNEACNAILNLPKIPFTEEDVMLIENNPCLNWLQKKSIIKLVKKEISTN